MRAMILAGGLSTRLYPLTLDLPKPLVPVMDRPVVAHVIEYLRRHQVDDISINIHYHADTVESFVGDGSRWGARINYLREAELMGSAGALKQLQSHFPKTFVVIGCDDVCNIDLEAAIAFHLVRRAEATIVLAEAADVSHYGVVLVDVQGRIQQFQEKPAPGTELSNLVNTGVYIFQPKIFEYIPADEFYDFGKQVFPKLLESGARFYGMRQKGYWCDMGTPREYRRLHFDALRGRVHLNVDDGTTLSHGVLIGRGALIDPEATIVAPACIGAGSVIESGAVVDSSILWDDVVVRTGAHVRHAVLGHGAQVEAGTAVEGGEYGRGARVSGVIASEGYA